MQLDAEEDIKFDIDKQARELMELSCMKIFLEQEVRADGVHLSQLKRQTSSVSNGYAVREYSCPMRHLYSACKAA